jgi:hypothetical protein
MVKIQIRHALLWYIIISLLCHKERNERDAHLSLETVRPPPNFAPSSP